MSQTPEVNSPIFNQLLTEYALNGKPLSELVDWTTPEFEWDPNRPVVQLDRQVPEPMITSDVLKAHRIDLETWTKHIEGRLAAGKTGAETLKDYFAQASRDTFEAKLADVSGVKSSDDILPIGDIVRDFLAEKRAKFTHQYPLAMVTDAHTEINDDGSATVVFEAVQPIAPVMPLSEKDTAKPME